MSYNWKCCSFYPNNFGASALPSVEGRMSLDRRTHVPRPKDTDYMSSIKRVSPRL